MENVELLGMMSYKILATDGTLFYIRARDIGCTRFGDECNLIEFKGIFQDVLQRVLNRLMNPERIIPRNEIRINILYPPPNFPQDIKMPKSRSILFRGSKQF